MSRFLYRQIGTLFIWLQENTPEMRMLFEHLPSWLLCQTLLCHLTIYTAILIWNTWKTVELRCSLIEVESE